MKTKKFISKVSVLTLLGATVLGSGAALQAKTIDIKKGCIVSIKRPTNNGCGNITINRPGCSQGNQNNKPETKPEASPEVTPETKPETKPETTPEEDNNTNSGNSTQISAQTAFENQVLALVNKERANYGLSPLTMDESVREVARVKSSDMSKNNYFSHTSPTYGSPFAMLKSFGISYKAAAENIAQGYTTSEAVVKGWMNSSGHRANILNASYTKIGIGYEANGNYWTQLFIG